MATAKFLTALSTLTCDHNNLPQLYQILLPALSKIPLNLFRFVSLFFFSFIIIIWSTRAYTENEHPPVIIPVIQLRRMLAGVLSSRFTYLKRLVIKLCHLITDKIHLSIVTFLLRIYSLIDLCRCSLLKHLFSRSFMKLSYLLTIDRTGCRAFLYAKSISV